MKLWSVRFEGGWYGGSAVVLAKSKRAALAAIRAELREAGLEGDRGMVLTERSLVQPAVVHFDTGDS